MTIRFPTGGPKHGKHRGADPKVRGDPTQKPGAGAGTSITTAAKAAQQAFDAIAKSWLLAANPLVPIPPPPINTLPGGINYMPAGAISGYSANPPSADPPTIENTGIEVGEIIAWRAWGLSHNWLYSINFHKEWPAGDGVESEKVDHDWGVHAFKERLRAIKYAESWLDPDITPVHFYFGPTLFAIGQVALWGDIWEFTDGWHAQYAQVESIDLIVGPDVHDPEKLLSQVRETYGVEGAEARG